MAKNSKKISIKPLQHAALTSLALLFNFTNTHSAWPEEPKLRLQENQKELIKSLKGEWKVTLKVWREGNRNPDYLNGLLKTQGRRGGPAFVSGKLLLKGGGEKYEAGFELEKSRTEPDTQDFYQLTWRDSRNSEEKVFKGKLNENSESVFSLSSLEETNSQIRIKTESEDKFKILFFEEDKKTAELISKRRTSRH